MTLENQLWLVRTSKNQISGPFGRDKIIQMINDREILAQDEVCASGHYWFFLHETMELSQQLGVTLPVARKDGETTSTETQRLLDFERTDPEVSRAAYKTSQTDSQAGGSSMLQESSPQDAVNLEGSVFYKFALWILLGSGVGIIFAVIKIIQRAVH